MMRKRLTLMLGSNAEDRHLKVARAVEAVGATARITAISPLLETPDYEADGPVFLNRLIEIEIEGSVADYRLKMNEIEVSLGRDRSQRRQVAIDIDIVTAGDEILKQKEYNSLPYRQLSELLTAL